MSKAQKKTNTPDDLELDPNSWSKFEALVKSAARGAKNFWPDLVG
jgi:hypothetical protein